MAESLHPSIDKGLPAKSPRFKGGTLVCRCVMNPVRLAIRGQVQNCHLSGAPQSWKPKGALLSLAAFVPVENVGPVENKTKLKVLDKKAVIQRLACRACGVDVLVHAGQDHAFHGLALIHPELFAEPGWAPPAFAAYVSSIIETGVEPARMKAIRARLRRLGLETYDCLSPDLMDQIAAWTARKSGALPASAA